MLYAAIAATVTPFGYQSFSSTKRINQTFRPRKAKLNIMSANGLYAQVPKGTVFDTTRFQGAVENIDGVQQDLAAYAGNVSIVVNVASACGYTNSNYKSMK